MIRLHPQKSVLDSLQRKKAKLSGAGWVAFCLAILMSVQVGAQDKTTAPLDPSLKPGGEDEISRVFEDVVAVQRKAKLKSGSFLFAPMFSFDFSDAPYTMYSLQLNFGYALGENFEIYLSYAPGFIANERNLSKQVAQIPPAGTYAIDAARPRDLIGLELNWVPAYGKDSWGPTTIIRSDTFFHFSYARVGYTGQSGNRIKLAVGKTFFISEFFNVRLQLGPAMIDTFAKNPTNQVQERQSTLIGLIETGLVFYF